MIFQVFGWIFLLGALETMIVGKSLLYLHYRNKMQNTKMGDVTSPAGNHVNETRF